MAPAARTERHREATKRQIMGVLMDSTNNGVAESSSPATGKGNDSNISSGEKNRVNLMIQDLQKGFDRHLESIKADIATWKQEQLQAHYSGMMKIPKATRQMTVKEFNEKYNCNLLDLLKNVRSDCLMKKPPACGTKRERALQTPAPTKGRLPMQTPGGTLRTVRKGEMMYSANGSPIDRVDEGALVATVTKKRKGNSAMAALDINLGEGNYISLNDPSAIQDLPPEARNSAMSQLKVLRDQMASLMQQLELDNKKGSSS